jgi:hypothetical protein
MNTQQIETNQKYSFAGILESGKQFICGYPDITWVSFMVNTPDSMQILCRATICELATGWKKLDIKPECSGLDIATIYQIFKENCTDAISNA